MKNNLKIFCKLLAYVKRLFYLWGIILKQNNMKNLIKQIADLYRIETLIVRNHKVYHKSQFEIAMERIIQIVFTAGVIGIAGVIARLIFNS